jgi:hypothetical protein
VIASAHISTTTSGDFIAFGVFIGLLVGAFGWLFHIGGREALAGASTSVGRSVGIVLCTVGIVGYLAAAAIAGVAGYGAWTTWRSERAEVAESVDD